MLIVEDDDLSQKVMRMVFHNDFEIYFCDSAEEYYEKHSTNNFDIIIMDLMLKGDKNGAELIKEIKAAPSYTGTPILCLTALTQSEMRQTAIESGADLLITKPVSNADLKETVRLLLQQNKSEIK